MRPGKIKGNECRMKKKEECYNCKEMINLLGWWSVIGSVPDVGTTGMGWLEV